MSSRNPVAIVGAGPVGSTLSMMLSRLGIKNIVFDKRAHPPTHPQAHYLSNRTLEIGNIDREVFDNSPPIKQWCNFVYCTSIGDPKNTVLGIRHHMEDYKLSETDYTERWASARISHLAQHWLEPILRKNLTSEVFNSSSKSTLMTCTQVTAIHPDAEGVTLDITRENGPKETIRASFVVGADGAHSFVRRSLGIEMEGDPCLQNLLSVYFKSKQLGKLAARTPGMLYFIFNKSAVIVLVAHNLEKGEFVAQIPFMAPMEMPSDYPLQRVKKILESIASSDASLDDLEILEVRGWRMGATMANSFRDKTSRVLLCGDAAHVMPPSGGYGMNLGMSDVDNLAWRLARAYETQKIDGKLSEAGKNSLEAYERERRSAVDYNIRVATHNFNSSLSVAALLGFDYNLAQYAVTMASNAQEKVPKFAQKFVKHIYEGAMHIGRSQIELWKTIPNGWESKKNAVSQRLTDRSKNLNLISPGLDLAIAYMPKNSENNCNYGGISGISAPVSPYSYTPTQWHGTRIPFLPLSVRIGKEKMCVASTVDLPQIVTPGRFIALAANEEAVLKFKREILPTLNIEETPIDLAIWEEDASLKSHVSIPPFDFDEIESARVYDNEIGNGVCRVHLVSSPETKVLFATWMQHVHKAQEGWTEEAKCTAKHLFEKNQNASDFGLILIRPDSRITSKVTLE